MINKKLLSLGFSLLIACSAFVYTPQNSVFAEEKCTKTAATAVECVNPIDLVREPDKYLHKKIKISATFDKFSTLGLDYKPAFKDSKEYIAFLIQRQSINEHTIPLSELKIMIKRKMAEELIELESGDKIEFTGTVFSNALGDAWVEVETLKVISAKSDKLKNKTISNK